VFNLYPLRELRAEFNSVQLNYTYQARQVLIRLMCVAVCVCCALQVGNEVPPPLRPLTDRLLAIARAMDERARQIDAPLFSYYVGYNIWDDELVNASRTGEDGGLPGIEDLINRTRHLGHRIFWDVHVGDKPKTVREWSVFFDHWRALLGRLQSQMRAVVLEENGHDHGMLRALGACSVRSGRLPSGALLIAKFSTRQVVSHPVRLKHGVSCALQLTACVGMGTASQATRRTAT
jgi:hypothetical protein